LKNAVHVHSGKEKEGGPRGEKARLHGTWETDRAQKVSSGSRRGAGYRASLPCKILGEKGEGAVPLCNNQKGKEEGGYVMGVYNSGRTRDQRHRHRREEVWEGVGRLGWTKNKRSERISLTLKGRIDIRRPQHSWEGEKKALKRETDERGRRKKDKEKIGRRRKRISKLAKRKKKKERTILTVVWPRGKG